MSQEGQIRKSLLIIKSNAKSLLQVESFLQNREWKIKSTASLKEALLYVVNNKPQFVMIPVDHPHPKMRVLPKILTQMFPICVIVYAEVSNSINYKAVLSSPFEYKHFPPVTGPGIERLVNKYYKDIDIQKKKIEAEKNKAKSEGRILSDNEALVAVKGKQELMTSGFTGENLSKDKMSHFLKSMDSQDEKDDDFDFSSLAALAAQSASEDPQTSISTIHGSSNGSSGTSIQAPGAKALEESKKTRAGGNLKDENDYLGSESENSNEDNIPSFLRNSHETENAFRAKDFGGINQIAEIPESEKLKPELPISYSEEDIEKKGLTKSAKWGQFGSNEGLQNSSSDPSYIGGLNGEKQADSASGMSRINNPGFVPRLPSEKEEPLNGIIPGIKEKDDNSTSVLNKNKNFVKGKKYQDLDEDSIMISGTKQALEDSVSVGDGVVKEELDASSNVACIMVESLKFSGYLIAALGKNKKMDTQFINQVQDKLFKFLKSQGEDLSHDEALNIKIKQVPFEDWAIEYAQFLRKSVHNGEEVAMAFFPRAEVKVKIESSKKEEMVSIAIEEFKGDVVVDFNMYIYLPANDKYVLYTPKGGVLAGDQKQRLMSKGVTHFHMHKFDVQDINKYRAQNYLNEMIHDYEQKAQSAQNSSSEDSSQENSQIPAAKKAS